MNPSLEPDNISNSSTDSSHAPESPNQIHIDIHNTADIELGDIHEENTLFHYTESHFTHVANTDYVGCAMNTHTPRMTALP